MQPEESNFIVNEDIQIIKAECLQEMKKTRKQSNSDNSTFNGDGGLYNLFSCDRINQWKATITCTLNCMGLKLGMVNKQKTLKYVKNAKNVRVPQGRFCGYH